MNEDDTYRVLTRTDFRELKRIMESSPTKNLTDIPKILKKHGWTADEYSKKLLEDAKTHSKALIVKNAKPKHRIYENFGIDTTTR